MLDRRTFLGCLAALGSLAMTRPADAGNPFILGILPIHSVRTLVNRYEPLRAYLERILARPVRIETGTDFHQFHRRTLRGDFDLVVTAIHFARLAQLDASWIPLAQLRPDHDALLVHRGGTPLRLPEGLRGGKLAVVDPLAITVMMSLSMLEKEGLVAGHDFQVVEFRSHASVAQSLATGRTTAAITTTQGLRQVPDSIRGELSILRHFADIPAFLFMARPLTSPSEVAKLQQAFLALPQQPEGRQLFELTGYYGIRAADDAIMRLADPYLPATRRLLVEPS